MGEKVAPALALTPDRSPALPCQQSYFIDIFLEGEKKPLTIFHPPIVFSEEFLTMNLQYLIQKGTLNEGHPLMSKLVLGLLGIDSIVLHS